MRDECIYIAGHNGMVGSALLRACQSKNVATLTASRSELDLCNQSDTFNFLQENKPSAVIIAAAKVGGIYANSTQPAEFCYENLAIATNLIAGSYAAGVKRLLFIGSSCIYPRECPQPIVEEYLLQSPLEKTNEAYALAKIAGLKMCQYYREQYGVTYHSVMPCNLYGPRDNYHPENSHVIPALIRRFHFAKMNGDKAVTIWGSGTPLREFLHADDLARACMVCLDLQSPPDVLNIGHGEELTIRELAEVIRSVVGYEGEIILDGSKPDGTPRKVLDSSKIHNLGWHPEIELYNGLVDAYKDFQQRL